MKLPGDKAFHFRYLLDDSSWENDHNADDYQPNSYGSDNSVVYTTSNK